MDGRGTFLVVTRVSMPMRLTNLVWAVCVGVVLFTLRGAAQEPPCPSPSSLPCLPSRPMIGAAASA